MSVTVPTPDLPADPPEAERSAPVVGYQVPVKNPFPGGVAGTLPATVGNLIPTTVLGHYAKTIAYILVAIAGVFIAGTNAGQHGWTLVVNVGIAFLGAVAVYWVPNLPKPVLTYAKAIVAFLTAAAQAVVPLVATGQITPVEWIQVGITAFAAIGVTVVPNAPKLAYQLAA